jgi:hypothetical protein
MFSKLHFRNQLKVGRGFHLCNPSYSRGIGKYTHSGIHQETPLNIDLGINNKRQDCKIGTVGGGRVNEGDKSKGIWLIDFIYLYELEQ